MILLIKLEYSRPEFLRILKPSRFTHPNFKEFAMRTKSLLSLVVIVLLLATVSGANARFGATPSAAAPQATVGSGFTFQGQLKNAGATVNGNCDMTFKLYDAAATGVQIGSTITTTVPVSNSLFTVMLNVNGEYGANAFNGDARWLEVGVKCADDFYRHHAFTTPADCGCAVCSDACTGGNAPQMPFVPLYRPQALDMTVVDPDLKGFRGGFTDGRDGYFVPNQDDAVPSGESGTVGPAELYNKRRNRARPHHS